MALIGIIANPASGKDMRRIMSGARVVSHQEKANIISRFMAGLGATGSHEIMLMPDGSGLSRKICEAATGHKIRQVDLLGVTGTWKDTLRSVEVMVAAGARVIVTLGGDGTNRIVAKACGEIPLIPISTGTNNVFPRMIEGTLAGLAAGRIAGMGDMARRACTRAPLLEVVDQAGALVDIALIDIAVVRAGIRGGLAVWEVDDIYAALVSGAQPDVIGLSAIAGAVAPVGTPVQVTLGPGGQTIRAAIAPAMVPKIPVADVQPLKEGVPFRLGPAGAMLALDGERELRLTKDRPLFARFNRAGPWVVDIATALSRPQLTEMKSQFAEDTAHGTQ